MENLADILTIASIVVFFLIPLFILPFVMMRAASMTARGRRTLALNYRHAVDQKANALRRAALPGAAWKVQKKTQRAYYKSLTKNQPPSIWVLEFDGDVAASGVGTLKDEVTAVLQAAQPNDEVLVRVNSSGGTVIGYGLAAVHLDRIRRAGHRLTVAVDQVAASGGYLMAAPANEIIAAPFAVLGSIGVIAMVPNARRLLQDKGVEVLEFTAGVHKRTVTPFSEVTEERSQKLLEQLADIHLLFKDFVSVRRPEMNIEEIATGEYWHGTQAHKLGLVDQLITSDEWLLGRLKTHEIYLIRTTIPGQRITSHMERLFRAVAGRLGRGDVTDTALDPARMPRF